MSADRRNKSTKAHNKNDDMSESFSYTTLLCRPSGFPHLPSAAENPEYINMKQVGMERHKFRNKINKIYIYKINTLHHFQILSL